MNKQRLYVLVALLLLLSNLGLVVLVLLKETKRHHDGDRPRERVISALGLQSDQVNLYDELIDRHRELVRDQDEQIRDLKQELYACLVNNDTLRAKAFARAIGLVQTETELIHYRHFLEIKKLCRPEQSSKFEELVPSLQDIFVPHRPPRHHHP